MVPARLPGQPPFPPFLVATTDGAAKRDLHHATTLSQGATLVSQNPGMNPTGTVLALAYLTGDGLVNQYMSAPGEIIGG